MKIGCSCFSYALLKLVGFFKIKRFFSGSFLALSIWSTYQQINSCIIMTNDMQGTAIDMANKENDIVKIKKEQVDPLLVQVTQEVCTT